MLEQILANFLQQEDPEVLCVRGPWGVGKTFAWKRALQTAVITGAVRPKIYSYVSLFGISSVEGMRAAILENLEYLRPNEGVGWIARKLGKAAIFVPAAAKILGQSHLTDAVAPLLFSVVRDQVICIDDVERRGEGLAVSEVLGLASYLNENRSCRIVILLNDNRLEGSGGHFEKYFEKAVSSSYRYDPLPAEVVSIAIPEDDGLSRLVRQYCTQLGIRNIRILRRVAKTARDIAQVAGPLHPAVEHDVARGTALLGWSYFHGEGAPTLDYLDNYNSPDVDPGEGKEKSREHSTWDQMLALYGWGSLDDLDRQMIDGLAQGSFDIPNLRKVVREKESQHIAAERAGKLRSAWEIYRGSFDDNTGELVDAFVTAFDENRSVIQASQLNSVLSTLREVGRPELADQMAADFVSEIQGSYKSFDVNARRGYEPISDPKLIELFEQKYAELKPRRSIQSAVTELASRNGWSDELIGFLAGQSVSDFEGVFRELKGELLNDAINACLQFQSISNASEDMKAIVVAARSALLSIGQRSPLNASRVRRFGVRVGKDS